MKFTYLLAAISFLISGLALNVQAACSLDITIENPDHKCTNDNQCSSGRYCRILPKSSWCADCSIRSKEDVGCNAKVTCTYDTNTPGKQVSKTFTELSDTYSGFSGCNPIEGLSCKVKDEWRNGAPGSPLAKWCEWAKQHVPGATKYVSASANCYRATVWPIFRDLFLVAPGR